MGSVHLALDFSVVLTIPVFSAVIPASDELAVEAGMLSVGFTTGAATSLLLLHMEPRLVARPAVSSELDIMFPNLSPQ